MEAISPQSCAVNIAANIVWNAIPVGRMIERLCSQADPQLFGFWSMVRRTCNTGGVWGDPDFSECTLSRGTKAFLLVWFVVQSDSVVTVNNRRRQLEEEVRYLVFQVFVCLFVFQMGWGGSSFVIPILLVIESW